MIDWVFTKKLHFWRKKYEQWKWTRLQKRLALLLSSSGRVRSLIPAAKRQILSLSFEFQNWYNTKTSCRFLLKSKSSSTFPFSLSKLKTFMMSNAVHFLIYKICHFCMSSINSLLPKYFISTCLNYLPSHCSRSLTMNWQGQRSINSLGIENRRQGNFLLLKASGILFSGHFLKKKQSLTLDRPVLSVPLMAKDISSGFASSLNLNFFTIENKSSTSNRRNHQFKGN